jgi:aspartate/methionine/tyrosine aminotransferase
VLDVKITASARYKNLAVPSWVKWQQRSQEILEGLKKRKRVTFELLDSDPPYYGHTNQHLSDYLISVADEGWSMYPGHSPWRGELSEAIVEFEKTYRKVDYSLEDIVLAPGVAGAWCIVHYSLLDARDHVLAIEPAHYMWTPISYLPIFNTKVISCPSNEDKDWEPDIEELRRRITDKTKFIVIDNPNNPTGAVYSEKILRSIVNVAGQYKIPIISDEIYGLITFDGAKAMSVAEVSAEVPTIVLNGMSKIFMAPGWRIGYLAIHDPLGMMTEVKAVFKRFSLMYGHSATSMPTPILAAATTAFKDSLERSWSFTKTLQSRRDFTFKRLMEIEGLSCVKPRGALYAFPRVHGKKIWNTAKEFVLQLTREEGVAFIPGSFFGESGEWHFRTLLLPRIDILEATYNRLERFLRRHLA